jgi:superfamily II DNA or RNA helicase
MSDESILVLTTRVDHAARLGKAIAARGVSAGTITGRTAKARRKTVLAGLKSGELKCVVATNLADEGLDVPRLSRIVLAFPMRAETATVQRVGRLMRKHEGKRPRLYDIVDGRVSTLVRRWQARARAYRELGLMD